MNKNRKGFTLIELLVVLAIIAAILAVLIGIITSTLQNSRDTTRRQVVNELNSYIGKYSTLSGAPTSVTIARCNNNNGIGFTAPDGIDTSCLSDNGLTPVLTIPSTGTCTTNEPGAGNATNPNNINICYSAPAAGVNFQLGVQLESTADHSWTMIAQ